MGGVKAESSYKRLKRKYAELWKLYDKALDRSGVTEDDYLTGQEEMMRKVFKINEG